LSRKRCFSQGGEHARRPERWMAPTLKRGGKGEVVGKNRAKGEFRFDQK